MFAEARLRRIAVIYANNRVAPGAVVHPTANTRHWKSYQAVAEDICETLRSLGLDAITMPDGVDLVDRLRREHIELAWLNTGGVQGESPMCHTPALLETAGIPYIGHTPLGAATLDDKGLFKLACRGLGLSTAPFIIHSEANGSLNTHTPVFRSAFGDYQGPFIVKPVNGRASQNVEYVEHLCDVSAMVTQVASCTKCLVLVERYLSGREYCIAVMGAGAAGAVAFSPVERCLEEDEKVFTSMDVKAITTDRVRVMDPVIEADVVNRLAALGTAVYNSLNLTSLIRLDIRADEHGELYILEANPKPDLKRPCGNNTSIVCTGLPYLGWHYQDLIACLFVERLWQLQHNRPYMLTHFMPAGIKADDLVEILPDHIRVVITQQEPEELPDFDGMEYSDLSDFSAFTDVPDALLGAGSSVSMVAIDHKQMSAVAGGGSVDSRPFNRSCSILLRTAGARVQSLVAVSGGSFTGGQLDMSRLKDLVATYSVPLSAVSSATKAQS